MTHKYLIKPLPESRVRMMSALNNIGTLRKCSGTVNVFCLGFSSVKGAKPADKKAMKIMTCKGVIKITPKTTVTPKSAVCRFANAFLWECSGFLLDFLV